ncbi:MAG: hypothetical protein AB1792_02880 [Candidatus Zixiibacteriota bacterium]
MISVNRTLAGRGRSVLFLWGVALGLSLAVLLPLGCGTLDNKGGPGENDPPEVFLVNVPPDRTEFGSSPMVYWYGTDNDGRIVRYDYAVVLESQVDSVAATLPGNLPAVDKFIAFVLNDQYPRWISIFSDSVTHPTRERVKLYASPLIADCDSQTIQVQDPISGATRDSVIPVDCVSDTIPQYMFLRAIDDRGATSKTKYRSFTRRNHWPDTEIPSSFDRVTEYISLPRLSGAYSGIRLNWDGSDNLDFRPPTTPDLRFHWRVFGPYPYIADHPPTLDDTLGMEPVWESRNPDTLQGVWVIDTATYVYNLWRVADRQPDPLNDTTRTRSGWFSIVVRARDDAFIADETPAIATFKAIYPKFERKVMMIDDTWYGTDALTNPSTKSQEASPMANQAFLVEMLQAAYKQAAIQTGEPNAQADTLEDWWWRNAGPPPEQDCPDPKLVRCGNYLSLEMLAQHRLVIQVSDDVIDPISPPWKKPSLQAVLRRYLDAGGMLWIIGRHTFMPFTEICQGCPSMLMDLCSETSPFYTGPLSCQYFDIEQMYYPGWQRVAIPINQQDPLPPASNDEFIGARLVAPAGTGLPTMLEVDHERIDSMYLPATFKVNLCGSKNCLAAVGVPDVDFLVRGARSSPLYVFQSWRPLGPIPPGGGASFSHEKVVAVRMVGPSKSAPLYKTAYFSFPMYFIKQEQAKEVFIKMTEWFFLPFSQS